MAMPLDFRWIYPISFAVGMGLLNLYLFVLNAILAGFGLIVGGVFAVLWTFAWVSSAVAFGVYGPGRMYYALGIGMGMVLWFAVVQQRIPFIRAAILMGLIA